MDRVPYFIWLSCRFCERMFRVVCGVRGVRCVVCGTKLQSQLGPDGGSGATGDVQSKSNVERIGEHETLMCSI